MKIEKTTYKNFGNCVKLSNGTVELYVTTDIGPRVISYSFIGGENVMLNDENREVFNNDASIKEVFKRADKWLIYGGHRLWTSPEYMPETYFPDDLPVDFTQTENGGIFTQAEQLPFKKQCSIEIELGEGTDVKVTHKVKNTGTETQEYAIWALTVLAPGGIEIIPMPKNDTGYLANRVISLWDYTNMNDPRVFWGRDYITVIQDEKAETFFKLGINNVSGTAAYINKGVCFVKKYAHDENAAYPDFGVSYETYTNSKFLEAESLGALGKVVPGQVLTHTECWTLKKCELDFDPKDEEQIAKKAKEIF